MSDRHDDATTLRELCKQQHASMVRYTQRIDDLERALADICAHRDRMRDDMYETATVFDLQDTVGGESLPDYVRRQVARLTAERDALKALFPLILDALRNGSACAPACSLEFLSAVPEEVRAVVACLTAERDTEREARKAAIAALADIIATPDDPMKGVRVYLPFTLDSRAKAVIALAAKLP